MHWKSTLHWWSYWTVMDILPVKRRWWPTHKEIAWLAVIAQTASTWFRSWNNLQKCAEIVLLGAFYLGPPHFGTRKRWCRPYWEWNSRVRSSRSMTSHWWSAVLAIVTPLSLTVSHPNPFLPWSVWDSASTLQTLSLFNDAEQRVSSSLQTEWESQPLQSQGHLSRLNLRIATGISECIYSHTVDIKNHPIWNVILSTLNSSWDHVKKIQAANENTSSPTLSSRRCEAPCPLCGNCFWWKIGTHVRRRSCDAKVQTLHVRFEALTVHCTTMQNGEKLEKWPKTAAVLRRVDPSGHHMFAIRRDSYPGRCDIEFKVLHNVLNGCNFKHVFKAMQILLNPQCYWRWFVGFKNGSCNSPSMGKLPAQFQFHTLLAFPPTTPGPTYRLEYLLSRLQPCSCFYMLAFPWNCFPVSDLNQVNALLEVLEKKSVRGPFNDDQWYFNVLWIHCFSCKLATVLPGFEKSSLLNHNIH